MSSPLSTPGVKPTLEERCQRDSCVRMRDELKDQNKILSLKIARPEANFDAEVKTTDRGEERRRHVPLRDEIESHEATRRDLHRIKSENQILKATVKEQADTLDALDSKLTAVSSDKDTISKEASAAAKRSIVGARSAQLKVSAAQKEAALATAAAEREVDKVTRQTAAAAARATAAEARLADVEDTCRRAEEACSQQERDATTAIEQAEVAMADAKHDTKLALQRESRAKCAAVAAHTQLRNLVRTIPASRSEDEWHKLGREAAYKAAQREVEEIVAFFKSHAWRMRDIAKALGLLGWAAPLMEERELFDIHYQKTKDLMTKLEQEDFGVPFGLALRFDYHIAVHKVLHITQAASKKYSRVRDRHESKHLLMHKFLKPKDGGARGKEYYSVKVPRIAPPASKLGPIIADIEKRIGVTAGENGRMAMRSLAVVVQELLFEDAGKWDMPSLPDFMGGVLELPYIISFDGTGYGSLGVNTIAVRNPYSPQSANRLRVFGIGNCGDDKNGTTRPAAL